MKNNITKNYQNNVNLKKIEINLSVASVPADVTT